MKKAHATFRQAKWLKEKKCNVICDKVFDRNGCISEAYYGTARNDKDSEYGVTITAPEQLQVVEWLEEKGIIIELLFDGWGDDNCVSMENACWRVFIWKVGSPKPSDDIGAFSDKIEAYHHSFDYIIDNNLIG